MNEASGSMDPTATVEAFFLACDAHDVDGMLRLCTTDAQLRHVPMGRLETGNIHTVGRKAWSDIFSALPDLRVMVNLAVVGEAQVAAEVVIADHKRNFELPQAYFITLDAGSAITNVTVYWDNVTLGIEGTKAGALRLVEAIASLGGR